jgi:putative oxidoreductase
MATAIRKVHAPKGVWAAEGGWEYNAVLIAALTALIDSGPGDLSVDKAMGRDGWGPAWALGGLGVGIAASSAAIAMGRRGSDSATSADAGGTGPVAEATHEERAGDPVTVDS